MKRIVLVTGDKGGVGKSFTSRLLLDWYLSKGEKIKAYDTDKTNSTLYRFYQDSISENLDLNQLDTDSQETLDQFLNDILDENETNTYMLDCGARTLDRLFVWMKEVGFSEIAKEHGVLITVAFVLAPEKDCVQILKDVMLELNDQVDYVIIKNKGKGSDFRIYEESQTRQKLIGELNAKEIDIPPLFQKTALEVDRKNMPFSIAKESTALSVTDRSRLRTYEAQVTPIFDGVQSLWM